MEMSGQLQTPASLTKGENLPTPMTVDHSVVLDGFEKGKISILG